MALATLGSVLQAVGDAGSQVAESKTLAYQQRLQKIFDALGIKREQTEEAQREVNLEKSKLSDEAKLQQQIDAAERVLKRKLTESEKLIFLGLPGQQASPANAAVRQRIEQGLTALPEGVRRVIEPAIRSHLEAGEYDLAMKVFDTVAEKFQEEPRHKPQVLRTKAGTPYGMEVGNEDIVPGSTKWNEGYQKVLDAEVKAVEEDWKRQEKIAEAKRRAALAKEARGLSSKQMESMFRDYDAAEKIMAPLNRIEDVAERAKQYVAAPTGPGDVALLLAYVEATKPQTGFRFTTAEQNLIRGSRGWVEAAQAKVEGGFTGILFGDEQRKIIGQIIDSAGSAVEERKNNYLRGILKINPKLYNILTGTEEGGPTPPPPLPPGAVAVSNP